MIENNEIKKHNELKQLNLYFNNPKKNPSLPEGYTIIKSCSGNYGFSAFIGKKDDTITIVYKGSEKWDIRDWGLNNLFMWMESLPMQTKDAISLYKEVEETYGKDYKIEVSGYSLGGSLAQIVAYFTKCTAVTFNAYGTLDVLKRILCNRVNVNDPNLKITNYCNYNDFITTMNAANHIGTCYEIMSKPGGGMSHLLENMESLIFRVLSSPEELQEYYDKKKRKEEEWNYYKRTGRRMPIRMPSMGCVGSYPVSGYTRGDGTEVRGYTRHCGAKHLGQSSDSRPIKKRLEDMTKEELDDLIYRMI